MAPRRQGAMEGPRWPLLPPSRRWRTCRGLDRRACLPGADRRAAGKPALLSLLRARHKGCCAKLPGIGRALSNGPPPAGKTVVFETRQATSDRLLRLGRLLAPYGCPFKIGTETINAPVDRRRHASRTRRGDRTCESTRHPYLVIQGASPLPAVAVARAEGNRNTDSLALRCSRPVTHRPNSSFKGAWP